MRSTKFVAISVILHLACLLALTLTPIRTQVPEGDRIEVQVGEAADVPGVEAGEPDVTTQAAPEPAAPVAPAQPQTVAAPAPAPIPAPVEKVIPKAATAPEPKPAVKAAAVKTPVKPAPTKTASAPKAKKAVAATPVIHDDSSSEPAMEEFAKSEVESDKSEYAPVPVKEKSPVGVEAATEETEAQSADIQKGKEDPAPVAAVPAPTPAKAKPVPTPTPVAASNDEGQGQTGASTGEGSGDLGKGGATIAGAVSVSDLKQMPGNKGPAYPQQARLERRQGQMELVYRVTKEGAVSDLQITKSTGSKDLDEEALRAIAKFKFVPGQEGWARHPVVYSLKGEVTLVPSRLRKNGAQAQSE